MVRQWLLASLLGVVRYLVLLSAQEPVTSAGIDLDGMFASEQATPDRLTASAEYLLWWTKNQPVPGPLVTTTSTLNGTGIIGAPGTSVLCGDGDLDSKLHSGG